MTVQERVTRKPVDGSMSLGVKTKQVIYISEKDGRNNPQYLKDHTGQIVVLSESDYAQYLRQEYLAPGTGQIDVLNGVLLNDSEDTTLFASTIDKGILVPGIPTWDKTALHYISTDVGIVENITVNFEASPSDPGDGSFTYHVYYEPTTATTIDTTSPSTVPVITGPTTSTNIPVTGTGSSGSSNKPQVVSDNTNSPVGTITTLHNGPSFFQIQWASLINAISYTVTVTGNHVPYASPTSGSCSYVVPAKGGTNTYISNAIGALNSGMYSFRLNNSGVNFAGTYYISVQVNYAKGSSTGVSYSVTV